MQRCLITSFSAAFFATQQKEWKHKFSLEGYREGKGAEPTMEELDTRIRKAITAIGGKFEHQLSQDRELADYMNKRTTLSREELLRVLNRINGLLKAMRY